MNLRIGFKLQVAAMLGFHSLYHWCFYMMWLFSGAPEDPEDNSVMDKNHRDASCPSVKSTMDAVQTHDEATPQGAPWRMIPSTKPCLRARCIELKLANGTALAQIPSDKTFLTHLECTWDPRTKQMTLVE